MADEEAEKDRDPKDDVNVVITELKQRLEELQETAAKESTDSRVQSSFNYCQDFCRALLEYAGRWRIEDEPLPVVQVYIAALQSFAETSAHLSVECDNVPLVVDRLARSFLELLLSLKELSDDIWNDFRSCVQVSHGKLQENGITQLSMLWTLGQQTGVWANPILQGLLSGEELKTTQIEHLLVEEGPSLLELRVKQLIKDQQLKKAAQLAKVCSESALCDGKANFKQMYLVCLCTTLQQDQLMEELNKVDCQDALEMICNLESDGDEKAAFTLCSAFLTRQLLQADAYCSWELTLFWSKLLKRLEPSEKAFLDKCGQMSLLSKTVYHILFLIKVIQSEITEGGLPMCIEMCIRALRMQSEDGNTTATVCKTIACLLPNDLEVKRACQLTVFLLEPTVDSYYTVETLYNEPDQKMDEEKMPVPNSLRCELLLVFKTQWSFDPEFWDWKTLKRHCLSRMGPEASIVSSIDSLNDTDDPEEEEEMYIDDGFLESADRIVSGTYELTDKLDRKQKNREQKKLREKGFISARFRNWQVYMQYCVLCDKEFLGHRIIRHAQTHFSRGVYSCPICAQSFSSKDTLVPHVTSHVKQSCKDRLTAMKTNRKLANPKTAAPVIAAIMAKTESDVSEGGGSLGQKNACAQNVKAQLLVDRGEDHVCPVGTCKKTFKFYRNLLAHVRSHNENEEALSYLEMQSKKVVCQYCRRHFINVNHLNDHLQVHCGAKPYICIQLNCKASFLSNTELLVHRKTHPSFKARCLFPNCGKIFNEAFKLYDHEAKHYKTFTCKSVDCGKVFHTQQQLDLHSKCHVIKEELDVSAPDEHLQAPQTSSFNIAPSIPDPPPLKEAHLQPPQTSSFIMAPSVPDPPPLKEADDSTEKCRAETVSVGKPETLENLLKASQTPIKTVDRYEIKAEEKECFISEANQIVNAQTHLQPENGCCKNEDCQSQSPDLLNQYQKQHASPFEATLNKMLRENTMLQSQIHVFSSNVNNDIVNYSDVPLCTAAMPTLAPTQPMPAPLAVKLPAVPPAVATLSVKQKEDFAKTETVLRERYHCPFENCTRNYSCYKSVSKHIKTSHPELYAIRKIPRSEIRVTYVSGLPLVPKPVIVKTQDNQNLEMVRPKIIQHTPYTNMVANYNAVKLPPPVTVNQTGPQIMENVLNPIVVAQLKTSLPPQTCSQMQKSLPKVPQKEQVQNFSTSITNLPRQPEFITASLMPKGLAESNPAITLTNSIPSIHLPPCSQIKTQDVRTVWSAPPQSQQLSNNTSQLHPTRLSTSVSMPVPANNRTSISTNPNNMLVNSLTNGQKDMQSSAQHLYRTTASNTVLLPKVQIKTEGQNLSLWSPASEIKHVQSGSPSQMLTNRPVVAANAPVPLKEPCNTPSNTHCSSLPLYTPPSENAALTLFGQSNLSHTGHQMSRQIQNTQIATVKPSQIFPKVMNNCNVPIPTKCSHFNPVQSNIATHIPATSLQMSTKPLVPANIKREENCDVSSFTMQRDSRENTNNYTNTVQNPSSQPGNQDAPDNNPANCKTVRKRNKVRWPAIVRDGKWFCSRCYRAFSSSKSLGGHLSKRTACIPYNELELNADLPASFLDLLNSDQIVNRQQNFPNNPCQTIKNRPHSSKSPKLLEQKGCTSQKCQEKLNGETSNDILKQIMTASNMEDLFVPSHMPQFQKPCVSSGTSFQRSSVKQSIDGVGDFGLSKIPNCPQSRPPGSRYPTPLLSQALKNNKSASVNASSSPQEINSKDQASVTSMFPPLVHPKNPATNNIKQPERSSYEQDIKKKLREQILAGDFQRRSNLANVCHNSEAQSPISCSSEASSKNKDCQMKWDVQGYSANGKSPAIIPGTPAEIEELLKTKSFTCLRQNFNPEQDMQSSTSIALSPDVDTEPQQLSPSQQWCFSELKIAFEKLNLIRDSPEPVPEPVTLNIGLDSSSTSSEVTLDDSLAMPKIFACEADNCAYNTFSSEAYWRHLYKTHNYTFEQVNAVKKNYGQYAPFQCQRCTKKFTRNPNLKSHYISAHQLSFEEINELDLKRKKDRAAMARLITLQNGGARKRRLPTSVHQELLHQTQSNPGGTIVIQALPNTSKDPQRTAANVAHLPQTDVPYPAKGLLSPGKPLSRPAVMKPCNDLIKKTDKKSTSSDALSQYKPYRCVHQDCEAAFAIQHNLILHYRAVHQSALSALEVNKEQDQIETDGDMEPEEEEEEPSFSEFRCQVKDCSRVFQQVPQLMQHYLRLHEFSIDKVGDLLSVIRLGRFTCGHEGCAVSFTAFWKYIAHIKELHKDIKLSKPENMYKCEIEGCDRAYATKSNMLRHLMKKHNDFYQLKQKSLPKPEDGVKQNAKKEYQHNKTSDGKENIESNQTSTQKDNNAKRTRKINNYWTRYEKPVLKSNVEASAMCTKSYPLQYPCMIKGCESVMNSEKSILKHYTVHGLSEKFLEQHRSHYIFCKKFPRQKNGSVRSDDSKSDQSSDSEPELTGLNGTDETHFDDSKPFLRKRTSPILPAALLDGLSHDDSSDGSVVLKRKRGRPKRIVEKIIKRKKISPPPKVCESRDECSDSSVPLSEKELDQSMSLAAFKPMGFEMSFLKFLEQSNKPQPSLSCEIPLIGPWVRLSQLNTKETCVKFSNRQNLKSLDKVKIVMDKTFLGVTEMMLKQLQDMQPMVMLDKK